MMREQDKETAIVCAREELQAICRVSPQLAAQQWLDARCEALRNEQRAEQESEAAQALRMQLSAVRAILKTAVVFAGNEDDVLELATIAAAKIRGSR